MKSPLWILNSVLLLLFLIVFGYILLSIRRLTEVPARTSLKVPATTEPLKRESAKPQDTQFIYERDPFATYRPTQVTPKPTEMLPSLPQPPAPKPVVTQPKPLVQFLEPLPIKITGIIYSSNEAKSQVTLINTNTKRSETHKVGDKIFDAYIIRIFSKKIILIRSNGQQETIYMYPADAQAEIKALQETSWSDIVQKQSEIHYLVNPKTFITRIGNLAHLIEILDLTTAFRQGESIGCRIGKMDTKSLGYALGFLPNDIITSIQGIKPNSTSNRITIYNTLAELSLGDTITVEIARRGTSITQTYTLYAVNETPETAPLQTAYRDETSETNHYKTIDKYSQRPDIQNIKKYDKYAMRNYGGRQAALKSLHATS
jgi:type II secretory pathway component PulC